MTTNKDINKEEENPEKYFDETNYSTLVVGPDKFITPKKMLIEDVVEILRSNQHTLKNEALLLLKEQNAQQVLIDGIEDDDFASTRHLLVAACWECGLDFSKHLDTFVELTGDKNPMISLEAITVLENIDTFDSKETLTQTIKQLSAYIEKKHPNAELMKDVKMRYEEILEEI